jgi:hypothetical protein
MARVHRANFCTGSTARPGHPMHLEWPGCVSRSRDVIPDLEAKLAASQEWRQAGDAILDELDVISVAHETVPDTSTTLPRLFPKLSSTRAVPFAPDCPVSSTATSTSACRVSALPVTWLLVSVSFCPLATTNDGRADGPRHSMRLHWFESCGKVRSDVDSAVQSITVSSLSSACARRE